MYKDLISYELADGVSEDKLKNITSEILESWMKNLEGFQSWEIHKNSSGGYTDIVTWKSEAAAKAAEAKMGEVPNAAEWFGCYKEGSIKSEKLISLL